MSAVIIIGVQWGDEGKGKIVDALCPNYVIRYQGGANAGHTLYTNGKKIILHLIPSGILQAQAQCIISAGVAVDPFALSNEISNLKKMGFLLEDRQLLVSDSATLVLEYHKKLDVMREEKMGSNKIGTTGKGIGPAYEERSSRKALLFRDLFLEDSQLKEKLEKVSEEKLFLLKNYYACKDISFSQIFEDLKKVKEKLAPYRCSDTSLIVHQALQKNKKVLFEGAQGVLLDLFQGTYPYVTSSSTTVGSALTGTGVGWDKIDRILGVAKAYTTRVGRGPFPSECHAEEQEFLQKNGQEFGSTTQRIRRCGWLDLVALRYAVRINGISHLALTKVDVLSGLKKIKVCTAYQLNGKKLDDYVVDSAELGQCRPVYQEFDGWDQDLKSCRKWEELPNTTRKFIDFIENHLKTPLSLISVGANQDEMIVRNFSY